MSRFVLCVAGLSLFMGCEGDTFYYFLDGPTDSGVTEDSSMPDAEVDAGGDAAGDAEPEPEEEIVIGAMFLDIPPVFGPMLRASQLAVDEVNNSGGLLNGRPVRLEYRAGGTDGSADPFRDLIDANAVAVAGPMTPFAIMEITDLAAAAEIPFLSIYGGGAAPWPPKTEETGLWGRSIHRINSVRLAESVSDEAVSQGCSTIGLISISGPMEDIAVNKAVAIYESKGLTFNGVAYVDDFEPGDVTEELSIFAGDNMPECMVVDSHAMSVAVRDAPAGYADIKHIVMADLDPSRLGVTEGESIYNGSAGYAAIVLHPERNATYLDLYETTFNESLEPQMFFTMAGQYDLTALLLLAIEQAGSTTDGAAIRDAIPAVGSPGEVKIGPGEIAKGLEALRAGKTIDYEGATGTADFSPGSYPVSSGIRCYRIVDIDTLTTEPCE